MTAKLGLMLPAATGCPFTTCTAKRCVYKLGLITPGDEHAMQMQPAALGRVEAVKQRGSLAKGLRQLAGHSTPDVVGKAPRGLPSAFLDVLPDVERESDAIRVLDHDSGIDRHAFEFVQAAPLETAPEFPGQVSPLK